YGAFTFHFQPEGLIAMHYIDFMVVTLVTSVLAALAVNRFALRGRARFVGFAKAAGTAAA
ncbi:MAG: SLC5 family protein, partial [Erythrobacter sp.]|nr:SLC5 family protein [Erythrobacter sp.]